MDFQDMGLYEGDETAGDNVASLPAHEHNDFEQDQQRQVPAVALCNTGNKTKNKNGNIDVTNNADTIANVDSGSQVPGEAVAESIIPTSEVVENGKESEGTTNDTTNPDLAAEASESSIGESETVVEERLIAENSRQITQDATNKLHAALQRIKNVTKSMLTEMEIYLDSAQSVEVDYIRCQHSQRKEGRRLNEVEPDIHGTTSALKFGMN